MIDIIIKDSAAALLTRTSLGAQTARLSARDAASLFLIFETRSCEIYGKRRLVSGTPEHPGREPGKEWSWRKVVVEAPVSAW